MRIHSGIRLALLLLPMLLAGRPALSDERAGTVVRAEDQSQIEVTGQDPESFVIQQGETTRDVYLDQRVTAQQSPPPESQDGYLQMNLEDKRNTLVILRSGSLRVTEEADERICHVTGKVLFSGKPVRDTGPEACDVLAGGFYFRHLSTEFLIDARGIETSLFVIEGSVEVFSEDPDVPERQVVVAGEWLVTRRGEPIPEPMRYRRTDVVSGSSECIYSWCRITRDLLPDERIGDMRVLIPPPPNPPGRR